jgi:hypothetical protein
MNEVVCVLKCHSTENMLSCNNGPVLVDYARRYHTTISASAEKDPKATVNNADSESVGHKLLPGTSATQSNKSISFLLSSLCATLVLPLHRAF